MHRKDIRAIDAIKITEPFFCDASYNQIEKLGTLMVHVGVCNGGRDTCIHVPTTTPTYYHRRPQHFWKGGARIGYI